MKYDMIYWFNDADGVNACEIYKSVMNVEEVKNGISEFFKFIVRPEDFDFTVSEIINDCYVIADKNSGNDWFLVCPDHVNTLDLLIEYFPERYESYKLQVLNEISKTFDVELDEYMCFETFKEIHDEFCGNRVINL